LSEYHQQRTSYKDSECLVKALGDMGYTEAEVHEVAQSLVGYHGDMRSEKANIIVRRKYVGLAANDIGFIKSADGTYEAIISEFDSHKHNADWMRALKRHYTERVDMKLAKKSGLRLLSRKVTEVNGKKRIQLQFLDPRSA
jgi:hypothetical protein